MRQRERRWRRRWSKLPRALASMAVIAAATLGAAAWAQPAHTQASIAQPVAGQAAHGPVARHRTVVTLTFDDGTADQLAAARIMRAHGIAGTFFIITGAIGAPHYMTRADLHRLATAGNEIGGHTVNHLDLVNAGPAETRRQICAGRTILARWGFRTTSFAYPDGAYNRTVERIARSCGYRAARVGGGLASGNCPGCRAAESIPPADPYAIRTPGQVDTSWTLADLKRAVISAERSGGWLPIIFHHVCAGPGCGALSITQSEFSAFVRWLGTRASHGTVVQTMRQALDSHPRPLRHVKPAPRHNVVNSSLESAGPSAQTSMDETPDRAGAPVCWMQGQYGANVTRWQRVHDARTGQWGLRLTMRDYRSGGAALIQLYDLGGCSLPVAAGKSYQLSAWYQSTARTQFAVYYRDAAGRWHYWTSSPYFAPAHGWAHAVWQTPPIPSGASGLSYGLSLFANGTLTTDDYSFTAAPPGIARVVVTGVLAAMMALACTWALAARLTRSRDRRGGHGHPGRPGRWPARGPAGRSQAAGTGQRKTRPPVGNGRRAS